MEPEIFRHYLQNELVKRCKKNPSYSLRSFALSLDLSPASLSGILSRKRNLTKKMMEKIGTNMGLKLQDLAGPRSDDRQNNFQQITLDTFMIVSEWYHFAILELIKIESFSNDSRWIAKKLGITPSEVTIALERLERTGLIRISEDKKITDTSDGFSSSLTEGRTNQAAKQYQKKILELAIDAIEQVSIEKRDHTSITMAIDEKDIPKAKNMIREFRRTFSSVMEEVPNKDNVYQLSIGFYPLTKN